MTLRVLDTAYCKASATLIGEINRIHASVAAMPTIEMRRLGTSPRQKIAFAVRLYRNAALMRCLSLMNGVCREWNADALLPCAVLVRQIIETVAHLCWLNAEVSRRLKHSSPDLEKVYAQLMKALFGTKYDNDVKALQPEQILNCIDKLDQILVKATEQKKKPIRGHYDFLSEFAHPNAFGTLHFHAEIVDEDLARFEGLSEQMRDNMRGHILSPLRVLALMVIDAQALAKLADELET